MAVKKTHPVIISVISTVVMLGIRVYKFGIGDISIVAWPIMEVLVTVGTLYLVYRAIVPDQKTRGTRKHPFSKSRRASVQSASTLPQRQSNGSEGQRKMTTAIQSATILFFMTCSHGCDCPPAGAIHSAGRRNCSPDSSSSRKPDSRRNGT